MFGTPVSETQWRLINAAGAGIIFVGAIAPLVLVRLWRREGRPRGAAIVFGLCWLVMVGCVMHALVGITQRILSLTGMGTFDFPFWASIDRRASDLQALLFNEPWFLVEGLLWGAIAWSGGLRDSPRRTWWLVSAVVAILTLTGVGILSATGVLGRLIIG